MKYLNEKIFSRYQDVVDILDGKFPYPKTAEIFISQSCNFSCQGCHSKKNHEAGKFMSFQLFKSLIDDIGFIKGLVLSGGGEPTLNPDFNKIVKYAISKGIKVGVITNGSIWRNMLFACSWVRISVNALNENQHRKFNGTDTWYKVLTTIKMLRNSDVKLGLKFLNSDITTFKESSVKSFCNQFGVEFYQIQDVKKVEYNNNKCTCGLTPLKIMIDYDGKYYVCPFFHSMSRNTVIGDSNFVNFWGTEQHKKAINNIDPEVCASYNCAFFQFKHELLDQAEVDFL